MTKYKDNLPQKLRGGTKGKMRVDLKTEKGITIGKDYGFVVEEENGKVLAFDVTDHPELGTTLLFGNQIFALKFWDELDLHAGLEIISTAVNRELERRQKLNVST
jgi:hypothetical protein